jgi:hypothetical protein
MTLKAAVLVTANATQAKAELRALQGETSKTAASTTKLGSEAHKVSTELSVEAQRVAALEAAMAGLKSELGTVTSQNGQLKTSISALKIELDALNARHDKVKTSAKGAGGSVANLAAQFNDVGMMIAAGQSPMQMAIQQGTQITQVIGPMGAAGAAKALGTAFMSLLNPVNFVTYAVLAGGAALIQWAMGALSTEDAAKTTGDQIEDLEKAVTKYSASAKNAAKPTSELAKQYGGLAASARESFKAIAEADRQSAQAALKNTKNALASTFGSFEQTGRGRSQLDVTLARIQESLGTTSEKAAAVAKSFEALKNAQGPEQIAKAAEAARDAIVAAGAAADGELANGLLSAWSEALKLQAAASDVGDATAAAVAQTTAEYQAQASMQALITQYGEASLQVATAKVQAERDAVIASDDYVNATDDAKAALLAAFDAASSIASVDIAGNVTLAANAAGVLAANLSTAMAKLQGIRREQARNSEVVFDPRDPRYDKGKADLARIALEPHRTDTAASLVKPDKATGGGRSASADAATKEKEAVAELIKKLQDEQAILRESDPVKQEMLKHRKELAGASETERQKIEELIRAEMQLKSVREATDFMATTSLDALRGIVAGGDEASASMKKLANSILDAALQALWLGKGPLAGLFGITGNIFSGIFGGGKGIAAKADGGMTFGEGSGRADKNLTWLSAGEFTVNARATARYRPLLERINNGLSIPSFANGGVNGGAAKISTEGGSASRIEQHIHVYGATGNAEIHDMVADGVKSGLELYNREVLPSRVKGIMQKPRMSGG